MKQADLVVGDDYAYSTVGRSYSPYAARVRILAAPAAGKVDVIVVDPGRKPPWQKKSSLTTGKTAKVATANVLCAWGDYADRVEAQARAEVEARAEHNRRTEERLAAERPDPARPVEKDYESEYEWDPLLEESGPEALANALGASAPHRYRPVQVAEAVALLGDLPPMVRRDLLAALVDAPWRRPYGESRPPTIAVRDVFGRTASLMSNVLRFGGSGRDLEPPNDLFRPYDADFLGAISDVAREQGQRFTLPFVPRLPPWASAPWDDDGMASVRMALGWVPVALADTTGSKLHRLGCARTRSGNDNEDPRTVATMPWWELTLTPTGRDCGVCGGPAILHGTEVAHFLAAADAWEARDRRDVEPWQIACVGRLIGATTATRMRQGQFDLTLSARVWDALSVDAPGAEGWNAYYLLTGVSFKTKDLSLEETDAARELAVRRLNQFVAVLPEPQRLIELPADSDLPLVAERYRVLNSSYKGQVLELIRALFSLEGALIS